MGIGVWLFIGLFWGHWSGALIALALGLIAGFVTSKWFRDGAAGVFAFFVVAIVMRLVLTDVLNSACRSGLIPFGCFDLI